MEFVSLLLFLIFVVFLMKDYKKFILIFGPLSIICQSYMCIRYESPALALVFATHLACLFCYLIKGNKFKLESFPLKNAFICLIIINIIGLLVSPMSFMSVFPSVFSTIVSYFFVVVYYNEIQDCKNIKIPLNSFLGSALLMGVYFLYEYIIQENPLVLYLWDILPVEKEWIYYTSEERFAGIRCQSIMSICISWGGFCCFVLSVLYAYQKLEYKVMNKTKKKIFYLLLYALFFWGVVTCGSRSSYVFIAVLISAVIYNFHGKYRPLVYIFLFIGIVLSLTMLTGLVNEVFSEDVSGSSVSQRQMQFLSAYAVMSNSPIWGFGIKGLEVVRMGDNDLLGAESIWLQKLISFGLLGIITQITIYWGCYKYAKKNSGKYGLSKWFLLGWILFCTMTSSPGLPETYFLIIFFILCFIEKKALAYD